MKLKPTLGTTCSMTMARHSRIICTARLLPLLLLLTLPAVVQAQFNYTTNNGTITITDYTGPGGAVAIPSTINGLPVTRIGDYAFQYNTILTSVTIPNSVTSIGPWALAGCTSLTSITIPNSVISIGGGAFADCSSLTSVTIGNSVTSIRAGAFSGCTSLPSVTIPNSVTSIESSYYDAVIGAFSGCTSLTNVTIGNGVTSIEADAFSDCTSLTAITVDALNSAYSSVDGVLFNKSQTTLIQYPGGQAGSDYTIGNSVTNIVNGAFYGCTSLTAITVDALNSSYSSVDGVLFNKSQTTLIQYPGGKAGSYTIPDSVTTIEESAFAQCTSLISVTIPNSVTKIGAGGFFRCASLTSVTISNSVAYIQYSAFSGCTSLTNVTMGNGVTIIDAHAFSDCTSLTSITIPNSVAYIGDFAFQGCTSLTAITVDALNSAYSSLEGVLFNKSQTTLIQYPGGKAGSYTIPDSVTSIGDYAFSGCTSLTSITIPNSVTHIEWGAFYSCTNLTGVYFQGNAPSVGLNVFYGANQATVYYLPGTTGWGATFAGRPTARWLPEARTSDADFGVRTNQFGFNIRWASDKVVVVEASPNLSNPVWTPVSTNTLTGGSSYFSDPQWTNHPTRFYRLRSP